jgi:hypothetical protein
MVVSLMSQIRRGYIRGQALSYFAFALLFVRAYVLSVNSTGPFFSIDMSKRWLFPMPNFHVPAIGALILAAICIIICLLFVSALFFSWQSLALRLALSPRLEAPYSIMLLASFITSWLSGLNPIVSFPHPWFDFIYCIGLLIFVVLCINVVQTRPSHLNTVSRTTKEHIFRFFVKLSLASIIWGWFLLIFLDLNELTLITSFWKYLYNPLISFGIAIICVFPIIMFIPDRE